MTTTRREAVRIIDVAISSRPAPLAAIIMKSLETVQATNLAPVAPVPATNVMPQPVRTADPAPMTSPPATRASRSSNSTGFFILVALIGAAIIAAAVFYAVRQKVSETIATSPTASPAPSIKLATPPTAVEDDRLRLARAAEDKEEYKTAIEQYESYLGENARAANAAALRERVAMLKKVAGLLVTAETALNHEDFTAAKRDYEAVLRLRPTSRLAQAGIVLIENELK